MNGSEDDPGIIPLAVKDIFDSTHAITDREFLIRVSYMEIYNEEINDLLSLENQKLPIHESLERGVYVAGLREEIVNSAEQVLDLIKLGEENRHFGETNMNARSSRSHTIFRMVIESTAKDTASSNNASNVDAIRVSVLNLVDLAGSERIAKTGVGGVRLKEGKYINKSLMILGNVINKLSESGKQRGHIPYRDSKLTRILQPALGGNAKTSIICTLAPEEVHIEETKGTLLFASRAKRITNCAQVNEILTDAALLKRQKLEIEELRMKLQGSHSEILEQVILKQRNDMHKSELELEKLMMELEEERRSREELENCVREQQKKIDYLSSLDISSNQARNSSQGSIDSSNICEEPLHNSNSMLQEDVFKTPVFKTLPTNFVVRRSNCSSAVDSSPLPENFTAIANEDLWFQLNKGFTTDLDMLEMTPSMNDRSLTSDICTGLSSDEGAILAEERCHNLESECNLNKQQLEASNQQCAILQKEYDLLKTEKASLVEAASVSKQQLELVTAEKEELQRKLKIEKENMRELKHEIRQFSLAFMQREGVFSKLYTKSRAIVENLKALREP